MNSAGGDSESWSSSSEGEEQVIEISSHSRILLSPRKALRSAWDNKSRRIDGSRRVHTSKWKATQPHESVKDPQSLSTHRSFRTSNSGKSTLVNSPRTIPLDSQRKTSNNCDDDSESESEEDLGSDQNSVPSCDTDASFEVDLESPVHRRRSRAYNPKEVKKPASTSYKHRVEKHFGESMQSLDSPTTPGNEMEELKATLEKLARHDDIDNNQEEPNITSAIALHEYLTAATALRGVNAVANQTRPTEYTGMKTGSASFFPPRKNSFMSGGSVKTKSKPMRENGNGGSPLGNLSGTSGNLAGSGNERLGFDKKIFSTPPPAFGGQGAGFPLPLQKTSIGGVSGAAAGGSRAMLSALKALQDKIGRLEEERESLMQQLSDAKLTARKREAELASSEKKFSYELGQTKESARAAYDALRCDREELKLQLVKSEERRKAAQNELQHFHDLTNNLSTKGDDLQSQLQVSESHRTRLKAELKAFESDHKRIVDELQTEVTQLRQEQQTAVERNELLETQYQRESTNHAESKERLKDAEQTVASISQLNEKLVAKVMEATEAANQAIKKNKKLQQQIRPSTLLRPTAASRASAAAASEVAARRAVNSTPAHGGAGVSPAKTLKKKKASAGAPSTAKKPKKPKSINNMTLLREANLGKEIPFLLGNSVQPSFSLIGNIQDALRRCDTTYVMPTLLSDAPETPGSTSNDNRTARKRCSGAPTSSEVNSPDESSDMGHLRPPSVTQPALPTDGNSAIPADLTPTPTSNAAAQHCSIKHKPPAIRVATASPKTFVSPMQSRIMEDLRAAVESAEKEFKGLNNRYKDLVAQMETNNRRGASGSRTDKTDTSTSAQLSQALGPLLDELESKATQLNLLKQVYQQAANSTINPQRHVVVSPAAIRRKTASLRVLNEYRQLEQHSKNKGSGRSATAS